MRKTRRLTYISLCVKRSGTCRLFPVSLQFCLLRPLFCPPSQGWNGKNTFEFRGFLAHRSLRLSDSEPRSAAERRSPHQPLTSGFGQLHQRPERQKRQQVRQLSRQQVDPPPEGLCANRKKTTVLTTWMKMLFIKVWFFFFTCRTRWVETAEL